MKKTITLTVSDEFASQLAEVAAIFGASCGEVLEFTCGWHLANLLDPADSAIMDEAEAHAFETSDEALAVAARITGRVGRRARVVRNNESWEIQFVRTLDVT